jgi:hypothetical protein
MNLLIDVDEISSLESVKILLELAFNLEKENHELVELQKIPSTYILEPKKIEKFQHTSCLGLAAWGVGHFLIYSHELNKDFPQENI